MDESTGTKNIAEISKTAAAYNRLYETIGILRAPGGCPWDRDQTPLSMRRDLVEEVFEAVDAVSQNDSPHIKEELGDVILNATLIAYMYEQSGTFSVAEVLNNLCDKLIRRHPHVFPESEGISCMSETPSNTEEVLKQWDEIKEKIEGRSPKKSVLDEIPSGFPPILKAYKMQKKAAKRGFDWSGIAALKEKLKEEFKETQEAVDALTKTSTQIDVKQPNIQKKQVPFSSSSSDSVNEAYLNVEEELGDLLFAVIDYGRWLGIDASIALERANDKFYRRFSYVEQCMRDSGYAMEAKYSLQMEEFWREAKSLEQNGIECRTK